MFSRLITLVCATTLQEDKQDAKHSFENSKILIDPVQVASNKGAFTPKDQPSKTFPKRKWSKEQTEDSLLNC